MTGISIKIGNLIFPPKAIFMFVCIGMLIGIAAYLNSSSAIFTFSLVMGNLLIVRFFWSWAKPDLVELK